MSKLSLYLQKTAVNLKGKFIKNRPDIYCTLGIVGIGVGVITACAATIKAVDIIKEAKSQMEDIKTCADSEDLHDCYTKEDEKKDKALVYVQTGLKLVKVYIAPAAILTTSVAAIISSHKELKSRNAGLLAAYAAVDSAFKEYRKDVKEKFGEDVDRQVRYKLNEEDITETLKDLDTGEEKTVTRPAEVSNSRRYNGYARCFDESNPNWTKDPLRNKMFLLQKQRQCNDSLRKHGFVALNEVYDALGFDRTSYGQWVGWVANGDNPDKIDFGIYDVYRHENNAAFINEYERSIILDFNVDGDIISRL